MRQHPNVVFLLTCVVVAANVTKLRAADEASSAVQIVPPARGEQRPTDAKKAARRALVDAAREAWEGLRLRLEAGEAITPSLVELVCQASRRWCLAEIDNAADDAARDKARGGHLDRIKSFHELLMKRFQAGLDVSRVQVAQATYFLREAELWVARAAGEKK